MHYAVLGRVRYDDTDTCLLIEAPSGSAAVDIFHEWFSEIRELNEDDEENDIILVYVLSSDTPIKIENGPVN